MASTKTKIRKFDNVNRAFKDKWIEKYALILFTSSLTEFSLRIAWVLGKHKKPFSDAEIVRECMVQIAETLFMACK